MSFRQGRAILEGKPWPPASNKIVKPAEAVRPPMAAAAVQTAPVQAAPVPRAKPLVASGSVRLGAGLVALYLFIFFSRILDVTEVAQPLHIPLIMMSLLTILAIMSGQFLSVLATNTARANVALLIWISISFLFSSWHSGGLDTLKWVFQSFLLFIAITVCVQDFRSWMWSARALAFSAVVSSVLSFFFGREMQAGRIAVAAGTLADPNEYALILLVTAPFWWMWARNSMRPGWVATVAVLANIPVAIAFFRTGSRGGLVTWVAMLILVFWRANMSQRLVLIVVAVGGTLLTFSLLPDYLRERYMTLFSNEDIGKLSEKAADALRADVDSSFARRDMLLMSVQRTIEHPIFGVGPGVFEAANWDAELKEGRRVGWQPSHNSYTQASAELGIPGLIIFLTFLGCGFMAIRRVRRQTALDPTLAGLHRASLCLFAVLVGLCVGAFFLSLAYNMMITAILGLCAGLEMIARKELAARAVSGASFPAGG